MDGVLVFPIANLGSPPTLAGNQTWQTGPLSQITSSGAPAANFIAKAHEELPTALRLDQRQSHVDLWDMPIQVGRINVLALEYFSAETTLSPDLLLVHFQTSNLLNSIIPLLSLSTQDCSAFLRAISPMAMPNIMHSRGFALVVDQEASESEAWTVSDSVISWHSNDKSPETMLRGRLALSFRLAVNQFYSLHSLCLTWPSRKDSALEWDSFSSSLADFNHSLMWPLVSQNLLSQDLYELLRRRLRIVETVAQMNADYERYNNEQQARSARLLNVYAAVVGISALTSTWATAIAGDKAGPAVAAIVAATFVAIGIIRFKQRPLN